jgi:hypothetical protein
MSTALADPSGVSILEGGVAISTVHSLLASTRPAL